MFSKTQRAPMSTPIFSSCAGKDDWARRLQHECQSVEGAKELSNISWCSSNFMLAVGWTVYPHEYEPIIHQESRAKQRLHVNTAKSGDLIISSYPWSMAPAWQTTFGWLLSSCIFSLLRHQQVILLPLYLLVTYEAWAMGNWIIINMSIIFLKSVNLGLHLQLFWKLDEPPRPLTR